MTMPAWLAGAAAAWWAGQNLRNAFDSAVNAPGGYQGASRPSPLAYGWTIVVDCGKPGAPRAPGANLGFCATSQLSTWAAWNSSYAPTATIVTEKKFNYTNYATVNWDVARTWRFFGTPLVRFPGAAVFPGRARNVGALLGAPAVWRPGERGYTTRPWEGPAPVGPRGRYRWARWDTFIRNVHDEADAPARPPITVTVPRAIPYPLTKEVKVNTNTAAGRTFVSMLMAWNFMGDTWGLTSALWRALPREARGSSRALGPMLRDLYRGWSYLNPWDEKNQWRILQAAYNVSIWKFSDTVMGSAQSSLFNAQTEVAGVMYARVWATLDSHGRAAAQSLARTFSERGREENSYRR